MLRIRIVSAVLAAIAVAAAVNGATAQTSNRAGTPALLAGLPPPHETKAHETNAIAQATTAHKTTRRIVKHPAVNHAHVVAAKESTDAPPPSARPDNTWPTPPQPLPGNLAASERVSNAASGSNAPALDAGSGAILVNGQTVQIALSDEVNDIDLAADDHKAAASMPARNDDAAEEPIKTPLVAAAMQGETNSIASASWVAQVFAALGGAVAAAAVAWFLIGSAPQRTYG